MAVRGVDRCPGGWVAARVAAGTVEWHAGRFADLLQLDVDADAVGVDIAHRAVRRRAPACR